VGIEFCSTPGDVDSLWFLVQECHVKRIKIGSDDLTNRALVGSAYASNLPVILSTGMATLAEIKLMLPGQDNDRVTLLHCVSLYRCPDELANLQAMHTLKVFGRPVGYSDHCAGIDIAVFAAARGACMIEKHFTTTLDCIDAEVSVGSWAFQKMVKMIRRAEAAMGDGEKMPCAAEFAERERLRKGPDGLRGVA
jgi:sialic acid synthase SpsE